MSKARYLGTEIDRVFQSTSRSPAAKVVIWNPNRTSISDVVLCKATSPCYDITPWVLSIGYQENICWENNDDALSSSCALQLIYDPDASPIPITERTMLDGTPIRIFVGDDRVDDSKWVVIFTGVIRGYPTAVEKARPESGQVQAIQVQAVGREENYLNRVVTARSYEKGEDIGKVCVETAIEYMMLDRREIEIGLQDYLIGHTQSQFVDIEVLKGIYQVLSCVGKKPKFDSDGFLVAADTDLDKAPIRQWSLSQVAEIRRMQPGANMNNSVRLLGLSNQLTEIVERDRRLAHGNITAGWFSSSVSQHVHFSEDTKETAGRRAKDTHLKKSVQSFGDFLGQDADWHPAFEPDGLCFGGTIDFDTGYAPWVAGALTGTYLSLKTSASVVRGHNDLEAAEIIEMLATVSLVGLILAMQSMGTVDWAIWGKPVSKVFQQICSTATLHNIGVKDIKEIEIRNDWIYNTDVLTARARELLRRELIKAWAYEIDVFDDPIVEVDDVVQIGTMKFYVTSIRRSLSRGGAPGALMQLSAWRVA